MSVDNLRHDDQAHSLVQACSLLKIISSRTIIDNVNFEIAARERIAMLGASGSGKTTLLRLIAGLDKPTSGEIYHRGFTLNGGAANTRIRMVFQKISIYPHMTVKGNLAFPLLSRTKNSTVITRTVEDVAKRLRISHLLEQRAARLSGGEAQRVAIGKAIIDPPQLLLLDEPFSNLDQNLRWSLMDEIKSLHRDLELTTILVTHSCDEAMYFADRVMVLDEGRILQLSPPQDVLTQPTTLKVAQLTFKPPPNVLLGQLKMHTQDSGEWFNKTGDIRIRVVGQITGDKTPSNAKLVWMPQHSDLWSLSETSNSETRAILKGTVIDRSFWEGRVVLTLLVKGTDERILFLSSFNSPTVGENVVLHLPIEKILFFAEDTDSRLQLRAFEP